MQKLCFLKLIAPDEIDGQNIAQTSVRLPPEAALALQFKLFRHEEKS